MSASDKDAAKRKRQREATRRWRENNKDRVAAYNRDYRATHAAKTQQRRRDWLDANPDYHTAYHQLTYQPSGNKPGRKARSMRDRLLEKIEVVGECWVWRGSYCGPYGQVWSRKDQRCIPAHRAAYEEFVGPIADGLVLDHLCGNKGCCRAAPDSSSHLEAVTQRENLIRATGLASNARKTHCPAGHLYEEANTYRLPNGHRACRICRKAANQRNAAKRKAERHARGLKRTNTRRTIPTAKRNATLPPSSGEQ